jgi:hypothetical protein
MAVGRGMAVSLRLEWTMMRDRQLELRPEGPGRRGRAFGKAVLHEKHAR